MKRWENILKNKKKILTASVNTKNYAVAASIHSENVCLLVKIKHKDYLHQYIFILHKLSLNQLDYSEVPQNIKKTKQI